MTTKLTPQQQRAKFKKRLTEECEFLWSFCVRARAAFQCELPNASFIDCKGIPQGAHLVTRSVSHVKYDLRNGRSLCQAHHVYFTYKPEFWSVAVANKWPEDWLYVIGDKWKGVRKPEELTDTFLRLLNEAKAYPRFIEQYLTRFEKLQAWYEENKARFSDPVR